MGKFDGILFVTDLDGTLLDDNKIISEENKKAIQYFEEEGGLFTFITGRIPHGVKSILEQYTPKIPFGCINGGGIYDYHSQNILWYEKLDKSALEIIDFVDKNFPDMGIELNSWKRAYFYKSNEHTEEHRRMEDFEKIECHYKDIEEDISKVIFIDSPKKIQALIPEIEKHPMYREFNLTSSHPKYYELLPKNANKGSVLIKLADLLGVDIKRTVSVGDNDNDIEMLQTAGLSFAVSNASKKAKESADLITVGNNESAIADIIEKLGAYNL